MKSYYFFLYLALFEGVKSEINGFNYQQPSSKWAFAHSYSWVVSNYGNNYDPLIQQPRQQTQNQQQALQPQPFQQHALQNQAFQLQPQKQAVDNERLHKEKHELPLDRFITQTNSNRDSITLNGPNGQVISNLQNGNVAPLSARSNENTQEFIDGIVRKVIQETRGEFDLPTTRADIEKIVRKILLENSSNVPDVTSRISRYQDNQPVSNNNQYANEISLNRNSLSGTINQQNSVTNYPIISTEQYNPQAECIFNCGNSHRDGQVSAVATANSFYPINRSTDPRMVANSFTYTSV